MSCSDQDCRARERDRHRRMRSDHQRKLRRHECARLYAADVQHAEHDGEYDSHGGQ